MSTGFPSAPKSGGTSTSPAGDEDVLLRVENLVKYFPIRSARPFTKREQVHAVAGVGHDQAQLALAAQVDRPEDADKEDGGQIYFFGSKSDGVGQDLAAPSRAVATFACMNAGSPSPACSS